MKMKIVQLGLYFLLLLLSTCCSERQAIHDDFEFSLRLTYESLGLTKQGLDFPSQEALEICKQERSDCKNYSRNYIAVQNAKKNLLAKIAAYPERTLAFTLDTMCLECSQDTDKMSKKGKVAAVEVELRCLGAIVALYYFNQNYQDQIIIDRFTNAPAEVLQWIAEGRYEWFYNRPTPEKWIEAINKIPDDRLEPALKKTMIQRISSAANKPEKFGVML